MTPPSSPSLGSPFCRRLAFGVWALLGGLYVAAQALLLGWVGPAPAFFAWSLVAAPILLITGFWLRREAGRTPRRVVVFAAAVWLPLLVVAFAVPSVELGGWISRSSSLAMLLCPPVFTGLVLSSVVQMVPRALASPSRAR